MAIIKTVDVSASREAAGVIVSCQDAFEKASIRIVNYVLSWIVKNGYNYPKVKYLPLAGSVKSLATQQLSIFKQFGQFAPKHNKQISNMLLWIQKFFIKPQNIRKTLNFAQKNILLTLQPSILVITNFQRRHVKTLA